MAQPGFGGSLTRLMEHRGTKVAALSAASGIAEYDVLAMLDGALPSETQLRDLAPAFGFHAADLFVMADVPVPEDLTPLDAAAGDKIDGIVSVMTALSRDQRRRIHHLVQQLPQEPRPRDKAAKPRQTYDQGVGGFGAMLIKMLCLNRNLHRPHVAAAVVATVTRGDMYLSAPTYVHIGRGPSRLRSEWVAGIATTLGIPAGDLAAVTGVTLPHGPHPHDPLANEMAELIWNLRRLSRAQTKLVLAETEAMLVSIPDDAPKNEWNWVYHSPLTGWWGAPRARE